LTRLMWAGLRLLRAELACEILANSDGKGISGWIDRVGWCMSWRHRRRQMNGSHLGFLARWRGEDVSMACRAAVVGEGVDGGRGREEGWGASCEAMRRGSGAPWAVGRGRGHACCVAFGLSSMMFLWEAVGSYVGLSGSPLRGWFAYVSWRGGFLLERSQCAAGDARGRMGMEARDDM
jgi:hypothetical protein